MADRNDREAEKPAREAAARAWGKWLTERMQQGGLKGPDLAARLAELGAQRYDALIVHRWRAGFTLPSVEEAVFIARALGSDPFETLQAAGHDTFARQFSHIVTMHALFPGAAVHAPPYAGTVTASVHQIAAELRRRRPGLGAVKLHKLLYYCQGHHLAHSGRPLFDETISAWDMGPVVASLWGHEKNHGPRPADESTRLGEAELNTIGYVLSRYGGMTGQDLINLSHEEAPWRRADEHRQPGGSAPISNDWLHDYFAGEGAPEGHDLDPAEVAALIAGAEQRRLQPATPDDPQEIRRRLLVRG